MAESTIKNVNPGIDWKSATIVNESYGSAIAYYNPTIKMATITWVGNDTAPTAGIHDFTLPAYLKPPRHFLTVLRNADIMEARADGVLRIITKTSQWAGGTITYPLA